MTVGMPAGSKVEIEFVTGTWTDVTADVEKDAFTIKRGRTSEFSDPQTGTLDGLRLNNSTGKYTPQSQVLADGTANPYYPNILPRKRIRYSNTPAGVRFLGYIKGWPPFVDDNGFAWVRISATDRLDQLSRVTLLSPIAQETATSKPALSWRLTDPADSTSAVEIGGGPPLILADTSSAALAFGDNGPGVGDGSGVKFAPTAANAGQYLSATIPQLQLTSFTLEVYVNAGTVLPSWASGAGIETIVGFDDPGGFSTGVITLQGGMPGVAGFILGSVSIVDGGWHHVAVTRDAAGTTTLYVDGVSVGTATGWMATDPTRVTVGDSTVPWLSAARFQGNIGYVGIYPRALSVVEIATHAQARNGYWGDTTDQRIARWLAAAGLTSADLSLDAGKCVVGTYPQAGKSVVQACQDMATSEGGGSVFYVVPDGNVLFVNRNYRKPGAPVMTLDSEADLDGSAYSPSFDELTLVNSVTVTRSAASGALSTQIAQDLVSQGVYGISTSTVDTFTVDDRDALALAQSEVAVLGTPGFRLPQVSVDMLTATTAGLYAALGSVLIGSRIRVTNLPKAQGPATQIDLIVEGWTETVGEDQYTVTFDTTPADRPARGVYDDVIYGRYQCSGQTLNASLTNSATTVVIATAGTLPTFTTVSARYPMNIKVGAEVMTLTAPPPGSTSPQTFTGVTRGVVGTSASAQAAGAVVNLYPAATYTL